MRSSTSSDRAPFRQQPGFGACRVLVLDPQAAGALLLPAIMQRPSRRQRRRNGCSGRRRHCSKRRSITFTARCPAPQLASSLAADQRAAASGSAGRPSPAARRSGRRIARRISRTAPRWSAPRSPASKAATLDADAPLRTGHPLGPRTTALSTTRRSPTNWPRASTRRAGSRRSRMSICETPATAICVGEPMARCGNSMSCIRTSGRKSQRPVRPSTIGAPVEHLDLATVIKVSQAVSGEIVLEKLIDTLMRTAIEQAGAERGSADSCARDEQRIAAEATTSGDTVIVHLRDEAVAEAVLPESVLHYVAAHPGERHSRRCRGPVPVCGGSVHPSAPGPFHSLPAAAQPGQAHRCALPREQPGSAGLRAGPDRGAEAARLAGGDLAGEHPPVPRSRGTRSEDPAPGRRQHHRDLHLEHRRSDY